MRGYTVRKKRKTWTTRKVVQIDGSKTGKRKYHRGHVVEGQYVFGGIEQYSQKCLIVTVEDRTEATLVSHIHEWVEPGTTIVHDCWKDYVNLEKYGYEHKTVNHSVEFVNSESYDTNKIEGHWRQMKVSLPTHGKKRNITLHILLNLFGVTWTVRRTCSLCFKRTLQAFINLKIRTKRQWGTIEHAQASAFLFWP